MTANKMVEYTKKPVRIYCDFGGVFLSPSSERAKGIFFEGMKSARLKERQNKERFYHQESIDYFNKLMETGVFEVCWTTTWGEQVEDIVNASKQIGLKINDYRVLPTILRDDAEGKSAWTAWKPQVILDDQRRNGETPFIWIDDSAPKHWGDHVEGHSRTPSLSICPSKEGLTKEHVLKIIDWTRNHLARPSK